MRCISNGDVFKHDITIVSGPPCRRIDSAWWFLFKVEELDDSFDGDKVHLEFTVTFAEGMGIAHD